MAVESMEHSANPIKEQSEMIDTTYMLAQDLRNFAE